MSEKQLRKKYEKFAKTEKVRITKCAESITNCLLKYFWMFAYSIFLKGC